MYIYVQVTKEYPSTKRTVSCAKVVCTTDTSIKLQINNISIIISVNEETDMDVLFLRKTDMYTCNILNYVGKLTQYNCLNSDFTQRLRRMIKIFKQYQPVGIDKVQKYIFRGLKAFNMEAAYDHFMDIAMKRDSQFEVRHTDYDDYYRYVRNTFRPEIKSGAFFLQPLGRGHYTNYCKSLENEHLMEVDTRIEITSLVV